MKKLLEILIGLVVLLLLVLFVVGFFADGIAKSAIEKGVSFALGVRVVRLDQGGGAVRTSLRSWGSAHSRDVAHSTCTQPPATLCPFAAPTPTSRPSSRRSGTSSTRVAWTRGPVGRGPHSGGRSRR